MSTETVTDIRQIDAPYHRRILLQDVAHESGLRILRLRIREGTRFTILDIDAATARLWGEEMIRWAAAAADASPQMDAGQGQPSPASIEGGSNE